MTTLMKIGKSLDQTKTLEALARPQEKTWAGDMCRSVSYQRSSAWVQPKDTVVLVVRVPQRGPIEPCIITTN